MTANDLRSACLMRMGDAPAALRIAQENLTLSEKIGDRELVARTLTNMAWPLHSIGLVREGLRRMQRALAIAREIDNPVLASSALRYIAMEAGNRGELATAQLRINEAISARERAGGRRLGGLLFDAARFHLEAGELIQARPIADYGLTVARLERDPGQISDALVQDGLLLRYADKLAEARKSLAEAQALKGDKDESVVAVQLAELALAEGDPGAARAAAEWAFQVSQGRKVRHAWAYELMARAALALGALEAARQHIQDALAARPSEGSAFSLRARLQITLAQIEGASGDLAAAGTRLRETVLSCEKKGFRSRAYQARLALLELGLSSRAEAQRLRQETAERGFAWIARRAAAWPSRPPLPLRPPIAQGRRPASGSPWMTKW